MSPEQKKQTQINSMINYPSNKAAIENIGDPKITAFIDFQLECLKMREGSNIKDVPGMYQRFVQYINYCRDNGVLPTNMTCYLAVGADKELISKWYSGVQGSQEQRAFAMTVKQFLSSIRESAATAGMINTIYAIFLQKAHDGFTDQPQNEALPDDPLGEKQTAEQIVEKYRDVELPD